MILETGINQSIATRLDGGPIVIQATYHLLGSSYPNGHISAPIRPIDIVTTKEIGRQILDLERKFAGQIISDNKLRLGNRPETNVELTQLAVPTGIDYNIEIETLDRTIIWNTANQTLTLKAAQAIDISLETYVYFVDSFEDLLDAIDQIPA